jgi:uncharacterized membrane protein
MRHKQSVLRHGRAWIARLTHSRTARGATSGDMARARWLRAQLDAEEPELLETLRKRGGTQ